MEAPTREVLSTLTERQAQILRHTKGQIEQLERLLQEKKEQYNLHLAMVTPEGANHFDEDSGTFGHITPPGPRLVSMDAVEVELTDEDRAKLAAEIEEQAEE